MKLVYKRDTKTVLALAKGDPPDWSPCDNRLAYSVIAAGIQRRNIEFLFKVSTYPLVGRVYYVTAKNVTAALIKAAKLYAPGWWNYFNRIRFTEHAHVEHACVEDERIYERDKQLRASANSAHGPGLRDLGSLMQNLRPSSNELLVGFRDKRQEPK